VHGILQGRLRLALDAATIEKKDVSGAGFTSNEDPVEPCERSFTRPILLKLLIKRRISRYDRIFGHERNQVQT